MPRSSLSLLLVASSLVAFGCGSDPLRTPAERQPGDEQTGNEPSPEALAVESDRQRRRLRGLRRIRELVRPERSPEWTRLRADGPRVQQRSAGGAVGHATRSFRERALHEGRAQRVSLALGLGRDHRRPRHECAERARRTRRQCLSLHAAPELDCVRGRRPFRHLRGSAHGEFRRRFRAVQRPRALVLRSRDLRRAGGPGTHQQHAPRYAAFVAVLHGHRARARERVLDLQRRRRLARPLRFKEPHAPVSTTTETGRFCATRRVRSCA